MFGQIFVRAKVVELLKKRKNL